MGEEYSFTATEMLAKDDRIEQLESALRSLVEAVEYQILPSTKAQLLAAFNHARSILPPEKESK